MQQISVQALQARLAQDTQVLLLDVREPWEVALAAIRPPGVPWLALPMHAVGQQWGDLDPQQPVVCYCHHGMRSQQVVAFLMHQGFESVYNLAGGIDAWSLSIDPGVPRY